LRSPPPKFEGFSAISDEGVLLSVGGMTQHPHRRTDTGAPRLIRRGPRRGGSDVATSPRRRTGLRRHRRPARRRHAADLRRRGQPEARPGQPADDVRCSTSDKTAPPTSRSTAPRSAIEISARAATDPVGPHQRGGAFDKPITVDGGAGNDALRGARARESCSAARQRRHRRQHRRRHRGPRERRRPRRVGPGRPAATPSRARAGTTRSTFNGSNRQ
jgi:hypothetical protein